MFRPGTRTALLAASFALSACMTVRIEADGQEVRVVRHVGWLHVGLPPASGAVVGTVRGVGLASTPMGVTAGYTRQSWAALGPECRVVIWLDSSARLDDDMTQRLQKTAGVCLQEEAPASGAR